MGSDWRNQVDYGLRQRLRLSPARWLLRRGVRLRAEDKQGQFDDRPGLADRVDALCRDFHLDDLRRRTSRANFAENLYYLELLARATELGRGLGWQPPGQLAAADIGVSHWFYAQSLLACLRWWGCARGRVVTIDGYEADPWRLHADLFTRADHAAAHMAEAAALHYRPESFAAAPGRYHWVSMLFPFVFVADHRRWGLPAPLHQPRELLAAAWESLAPGGLLVIANQGDAEQTAQLALMAELGLPAPLSEPFDSAFYQYKVPRRLTVACRS
ncbi:MAG: hypothetical protein HZB16_19375 [Armatimonadetes bacterium]|nr:hypothetical protein [Armatimonadota bacterium]